MPILDEHTLDFVSKSPDQTRRIGMRLGALLQAGDLICLQGDLGAGKTTLVQGMAQGWGTLDSVSSPTFVLVNVYRRADETQFFHMDAYRIEGKACIAFTVIRSTSGYSPERSLCSGGIKCPFVNRS